MTTSRDGEDTPFMGTFIGTLLCVLDWAFFQNYDLFVSKEAGRLWQLGQLAREMRKELLLVGTTVRDLEKGQSQKEARREAFEKFIWDVMKTDQDTPFLLEVRRKITYQLLVDQIRL